MYTPPPLVWGVLKVMISILPSEHGLYFLFLLVSKTKCFATFLPIVLLLPQELPGSLWFIGTSYREMWDDARVNQNPDRGLQQEGEEDVGRRREGSWQYVGLGEKEEMRRKGGEGE